MCLGLLMDPLTNRGLGWWEAALALREKLAQASMGNALSAYMCKVNMQGSCSKAVCICFILQDNSVLVFEEFSVLH